MPTVKALATERPLRRDALENKQRLLEAAAAVFALHGLDASVEEVARVAGVGMGTLYRRFPTKDALITELVRELLAGVARDARLALERRDGLGLELFLETAGALQASQRGCLARMWGPSVAPQLIKEIREVIAQLLEDAQLHGKIREDVTGTDITVILWSLRGIIETTGAVAPDGWRRHLGLVLAGLRPNSHPLPGPALSKKQMEAITTSEAMRQV